MSRTFPDSLRAIVRNQRGVGLLAAIFVVVIVGMFGVLIARFAIISSVTSAEEALWAQALYSAHSAAQIHILYDDGGGTGSRSLNTVAGFVTDSDSTAVAGGIYVSAQRPVEGSIIRRDIQLHLAL